MPVNYCKRPKVVGDQHRLHRATKRDFPGADCGPDSPWACTGTQIHTLHHIDKGVLMLGAAVLMKALAHYLL